jgi:hypothetical protein
MAFSFALILLKSPSPMLVAVGMYLPFETTFAIYVGGLIKGYVDLRVAAQKASAEQKERVENTGVLLASGLIAGEALTGVLLAGLVLAIKNFDSITGLFFGVTEFGFVETAAGAWLSLVAFATIAWLLVRLPLSKLRS